MDSDNNVFHHSTLDDGCDYFTIDGKRITIEEFVDLMK